MTPSNQKILAVFADAQNVSLFKHGKAILKFLSLQGEMLCLHAYHDWRSISKKKEEELLSDNWRCIDVPIVAKNEADRRLMEDVRHLCRFREPDILVLITNDGDFSTLVKSYIESGQQVIVIGHRGKVSRRLLRLLPSHIHFVEELNQSFPEAA
jgi:hypothetical protein